jgi:hypothetical protein
LEITTLCDCFRAINWEELPFENVPMTSEKDVTITIWPASQRTYSLSPFPFAAEGGEFAFSGRPVAPEDGKRAGGWPAALRQIPTEWERFQLVAG